MSDEEKKNKKKAFIKWLINSLWLTGGATSGILAVSETEKKIEEFEREENNEGETKKKKIASSHTKQSPNTDKRVELTKDFSDLDLGIIETNGKVLTVDMIKAKLPTNIQNEVNITVSLMVHKLQLNQLQIQQNTKVIQFKLLLLLIIEKIYKHILNLEEQI